MDAQTTSVGPGEASIGFPGEACFSLYSDGSGGVLFDFHGLSKVVHWRFHLSEEGRWTPSPNNKNIQLDVESSIETVEEFATVHADQLVANVDVDHPDTPEVWERWMAFLERRVKELGGSVDRHSHTAPSWRDIQAPIVFDTEKWPLTLTFVDAETAVVGFPAMKDGKPYGTMAVSDGWFEIRKERGCWKPSPQSEWRLDHVLDRFDRLPEDMVKDVVMPAVTKIVPRYTREIEQAAASNKLNASMMAAERARNLTYSFLNLEADLVHLKERLEAPKPV